MNRYNRRMKPKMPGDWFFKVFPWIFGIVFVVVFVMIIAQFVLLGWVAVEVIQDPNGSAAEIGKIVGSFMDGVDAE